MYMGYNVMSVSVIKSFRGKYACFSNFHACEFEYNDIKWSNSEAAFQAMKSGNKVVWEAMSKLNASEAKKKGRQRGIGLRPDWDKVKNKFMHDVVYAKFSQNPDLKDILLSTGDAELIEGNWWHDNYWGDCQCERCWDVIGMNTLGKILMKVREELR